VNKRNIPEGGMKIDELDKFGPFGDMEEERLEFQGGDED